MDTLPSDLLRNSLNHQNDVYLTPEVILKDSQNDQQILSHPLPTCDGLDFSSEMGLQPDQIDNSNGLGSDSLNFEFEEQIDEIERKFKEEESRYTKLIANRHQFIQHMTQDEFRVLLNKASMRLVFYDPNTDSDISTPSQFSSPEEEVYHTVQHYIPNHYCNFDLQNQMRHHHHK